MAGPGALGLAQALPISLGGGGSQVLAGPLKPRGGHTLVPESAHGSPLGRPPGHRRTEKTHTWANSAIAPLAAQDRRPGGVGACPPLSPQSHRAAHPPCSLCCLKDTGPSPPASRWDGECLFQEISVSSSSTRTLSFSIGVLATAEGILRGENRHTHLVDLMLAVPTGIWKPAPPWPAYPQAPGPPTHLRESLKAAPASDVMAWRWE